MSAIDVVLGDMSQQFLFNFQRSIGFWWNEPQAMAHTVDVCVYCHCWLSEPDSLQYVGCFAAHARQTGEFFGGGGHLAVEIAHEHAGHLDQMLSLGVGIAHGSDVFENVVDAGFGHGLGRGVATEEGRGDLVDALIGALRAEECGDEQLEG